MEKNLPWVLVALLAVVVVLYLLVVRPRQRAAAGVLGTTAGGDYKYSSALGMTGGNGDYVRKFDNFGTQICPAIGSAFGVKIGDAAHTVCNYSRYIDPTHYLHAGIAKVVDYT